VRSRHAIIEAEKHLLAIELRIALPELRFAEEFEC
jgi:hypothetical protein